jgi:hypothetical protein
MRTFFSMHGQQGEYFSKIIEYTLQK